MNPETLHMEEKLSKMEAEKLDEKSFKKKEKQSWSPSAAALLSSHLPPAAGSLSSLYSAFSRSFLSSLLFSSGREERGAAASEAERGAVSGGLAGGEESVGRLEGGSRHTHT